MASVIHDGRVELAVAVGNAPHEQCMVRLDRQIQTAYIPAARRIDSIAIECQPTLAVCPGQDRITSRCARRDDQFTTHLGQCRQIRWNQMSSRLVYLPAQEKRCAVRVRGMQYELIGSQAEALQDGRSDLIRLLLEKDDEVQRN